MRIILKTYILWPVSFLLLSFFAWQVFLAPPENFPEDKMIRIKKGASLREVSELLKNENLIKNKTAFIVAARLSAKANKIKHGDYLFEKRTSALAIIRRVGRGEFGVEPVKIVVPEGSDNLDIAGMFSGFEYFDREKFVKESEGKEGYLFPDTYLFFKTAEAEEAIREMTSNFQKKVGSIDKDALIMASIIEKEASNGQDRKIISGILWKRIKIGMPLQVDAVFPYITREKEISADDKKIDSPYNTYLYKGLPPGPIANPGLDAIDAALNPEDSPYLYYLHDKNSTTRFARTYEEHLKNVEKYLK
ncbi:MAG: endolytic transglycosylase MltG [Candidatus Pacebacteria bacterium]|nr:endolytic transglycosylase MltG [Candidatus Paceibacterota bacterium]